MIAPVGKRRNQVSQSQSRHASIFDASMFNLSSEDADNFLKTAQQKNENSKDLRREELGGLGKGVGDAMDQGGLNENRFEKQPGGMPGDEMEEERQRQQMQQMQPQTKPLEVNELDTLGDQGDQGGLGQADQGGQGGQDAGGQDAGGGGQFIDQSQRLSKTVIHALGLDTRPGENWVGKTEITDDGTNVSAITIKLQNQPQVNPMAVTKDGPPFLGPDQGQGQMPGQPGQPGQPQAQPGQGGPGGPVTNTV